MAGDAIEGSPEHAPSDSNATSESERDSADGSSDADAPGGLFTMSVIASICEGELASAGVQPSITPA